MKAVIKLNEMYKQEIRVGTVRRSIWITRINFYAIIGTINFKYIGIRQD